MSGLQTPPNLEELFGKLLDGELQGAEQEQINQALGSDPAMRLLYRKYVMLDAALRWEMAAPIVPPGDDVAAAGGQSGIGAIAGTAGPSGRVVSRPAFRRDDAPFDAESANEECGRANDEPPVDAPHGVAPPIHPAAFLLPPFQFAGGVMLPYLVAALLLSAGVFAAWAWRSPQAAPRVAQNRVLAPAAVPGGVTPQIVATITRSVGCGWVDPNAGREGTGVSLGSCYYVSSGRLEITYNIGAKVLIEGPAMFAVDAPNGGFLQFGNVLVQVAPGERDARAKRWETFLKGAGKQSTVGPDPPAELANNPIFCIRFWRDSTHCHTIMSDRGAEFALGRDTDGSLVGYILKSPVWVSDSEFEYWTPRFLPEGGSVLAGVDKNGTSRLAVAQDKPPAALLRGLLEGKPSGTNLNRKQRRGS